MPETVFFKDDGKLNFVTTMDREGCLTMDNKVKLEYLAVRYKLIESVRERRQDSELYGKQLSLDKKIARSEFKLKHLAKYISI